MSFKAQTAIRGVFTVGIVNFSARIVSYGKHVVIAAYIGLTSPLDAFYMAMSILSLFIFTFGDIFDSLGIPRLVETLQSEGEESYRDLAGSILAFALVLTLVLGGILFLAAPWVPLIAPGFTPEKKGLIHQCLFFLVPMVLLYLPYHATGSFLRSRRRFQAFYLSELIVAVVSLAAIALFHEYEPILPVAVSVSYTFAFFYTLLMARGEIRFPRKLFGGKIREIVRLMFRLLPLYLIGYLFVIVDRTFASFLPTGGVSALTYGMFIVMIPASLLMLENIFITPLSETPEKGEMLRQILNGIFITSIPVAVFTAVYSRFIVKAALERGVFTSLSTEMTADALTYLALAIPATFINPVTYRLFQILGRLKGVSVAGLGSVLVNASLNYAFLQMGLGIKGLALATSISFYVGSVASVAILERLSIPVVRKEVLSVLGVSILIGLVSLLATFMVPMGPESIIGLLVRGTIFLLVAGSLLWLAPNKGVRHWRDTVFREILPAGGK
jgi:putative peptidoglycan lipid II flippase